MLLPSSNGLRNVENTQRQAKDCEGYGGIGVFFEMGRGDSYTKTMTSYTIS